MTSYQSVRPCPCGENDMTIGVAETVDGRTIYPLVCNKCGDVQTQYAKKALAVEHQAKHGPLAKVLTRTMRKPRLFAHAARAHRERKCEVCGEGPAQRHHWAPYYLFGAEAERWPVSLLCQPCHTRWHQIVTPKMSEPND